MSKQRSLEMAIKIQAFWRGCLARRATRDAREEKKARDARAAKRALDAQEAKKVQEAKEAQEARAEKEARETRERKEAREAREAREAEEDKERPRKLPGVSAKTVEVAPGNLPQQPTERYVQFVLLFYLMVHTVCFFLGSQQLGGNSWKHDQKGP